MYARGTRGVWGGVRSLQSKGVVDKRRDLGLRLPMGSSASRVEGRGREAMDWGEEPLRVVVYGRWGMKASRWGGEGQSYMRGGGGGVIWK